MIGASLDRLALPAPRLGIALAVFAGLLVTFRIVHLGILILAVAVR